MVILVKKSENPLGEKSYLFFENKHFRMLKLIHFNRNVNPLKIYFLYIKNEMNITFLFKLES